MRQVLAQVRVGLHAICMPQTAFTLRWVMIIHSKIIEIKQSIYIWSHFAHQISFLFAFELLIRVNGTRDFGPMRVKYSYV